MAALSIALVVAEARKISPDLNLVRKADHFEWRLGDKIQRVEVNQIRGLKMDQWLHFARALVAGEAIAGAPPLVANTPKPEPVERKPEPNPSFMLIKNKIACKPFDCTDPEGQGYRDAINGITACPFGLEDQRRKWNRGHDRAYGEGLAEKPRFGRTAGKRQVGETK